jgi:Phage Tail Collar Domain
MKRYSFLTAAAAAALAGCGRHNASGTIPGVSPNAVRRAAETLPASPIPAHVLTNPILGEMRRFDGATAPAGWSFAQGQTLQIAQNRALFGVLGKSAGGDGKTTFNLPNPHSGQFIIAVVGIIPKSSRVLAAFRPGQNEPFGVSVPGLTVLERPGYAPVPKAAIPNGQPLWAPGTVPTAELIRAQAAASQSVPQPVRGYGQPHAL